MFGIQCESCQKYITGKVLEVTPQLTPTPSDDSATHTLAVPAMSPSLKPGNPGSSSLLSLSEDEANYEA